MEDLRDLPDKTILLDIVTMQMPFGKYKGTLIKNLPIYYLEWLASQGFRQDRLGQILSTAFIIRTHGLDDLLKPIE
ncbi:MAG: DUF3820 family protein [Chitinophagales bacterium]|jgi:uncharacterized protein (DUF3820 family)|nr:DUF3820 family protein [Chitinophagales bacterium]